MTPDCKQLWRKVILRGIGAVVFGWAVVSVFVFSLAHDGVGVSPETARAVTATLPPLKFPENEEMLNAAAAQLAREGAALSKVEPAAGESVQTH
jgi:hypothetical protein